MNYYLAKIRLNVVSELECGIQLGRFLEKYGVSKIGKCADIEYRFDKVGNQLFDESQDYILTFSAKEFYRKNLFNLVGEILDYWTCVELISITEKEAD